MSTEPELDHERLDVYRLAVELDGLVAESLPRRGNKILRDQLERAVVSIVLNIAEGAGRRSQRRFYSMARGSATETAAAMDLLRNRRALANGAHAAMRALVVRLVQMLTRISEARLEATTTKRVTASRALTAKRVTAPKARRP